MLRLIIVNRLKENNIYCQFSNEKYRFRPHYNDIWKTYHQQKMGKAILQMMNYRITWKIQTINMLRQMNFLKKFLGDMT